MLQNALPSSLRLTLLSGSLSASLSLLKTYFFSWVFALRALWSGLDRERRYINLEIRFRYECFIHIRLQKNINEILECSPQNILCWSPPQTMRQRYPFLHLQRFTFGIVCDCHSSLRFVISRRPVATQKLSNDTHKIKLQTHHIHVADSQVSLLDSLISWIARIELWGRGGSLVDLSKGSRLRIPLWPPAQGPWASPSRAVTCGASA